MKANLRKILALVLSLVLLAVPTGAVFGETVDPAEEPDPSESTEAVEQLLDELTYFQTMVENSTLPQYLIDMILKFFGSAEEEQILVKEDGTLMTDEELLPCPPPTPKPKPPREAICDNTKKETRPADCVSSFFGDAFSGDGRSARR